MKAIVILVAAFSMSLANAKQADSAPGTQVKRLDNELKKLIGEGLTGETDKGKKCEVTYAPQDVLFRNKPTGETYQELLIVSKDSPYQDCGVDGINFIISKDELAGQGGYISKVSIGQAEIMAGGAMSVSGGDRGGSETWSHLMKIELENGKAKSVQLSVVGTCTCIIKK